MYDIKGYSIIQAMKKKDKKSIPFNYIAVLASGISIGMVITVTLKACEPVAALAVQMKSCIECHNQKAALTSYFKSTSKNPEAMADAVLATKSPRLMAAIAKVETGGNPQIRNSGYKKRHSGAFQVNPKFHGRVSNDPIKQALQAEAILSELTETMPIKTALSKYGGDSSSKYQQRVLAELERVP